MIRIELSDEEAGQLLKLLNWLDMEKADLDPTLSLMAEHEIAPSIRHFIAKLRDAGNT